MAWSLPAAGRFDQSRRTRRNRVWSLLDFVPKALTFERADPGTITESTARPLDASAPVAATAGHGDSSMLAAFAAAVQAP
jgi:hypothetical protein